MTYLVFRSTADASSAETFEYLGVFGDLPTNGGESYYSAQCGDGLGSGGGAQKLYFVPVPIVRDLPASGTTAQLIAGAYAKALPGQKMNLSVADKYITSALLPGVTIDTFHWTLLDVNFKTYQTVYTNETSPTSGILTPMVEADLNQKDTHFYWADSGKKCRKSIS